MQKLRIKNHYYSEYRYTVYAKECNTVPDIGDVFSGSEEQAYVEVITHVLPRYLSDCPQVDGEVFEVWTDVNEYDSDTEQWQKSGQGIGYVWTPYQED